MCLQCLLPGNTQKDQLEFLKVILTFIYYCHKVKHIFYTIPIFEVMKNNLSFEFYSTCTHVFWLPNLDKFE